MKRTTLSVLTLATVCALAGTALAAGPTAPVTDDDKEQKPAGTTTAPGSPSAPGAPGTKTAPGTPGTTTAPGAPGAPATPGTSTAPGTPGAPGSTTPGSTAPGAPGSPAAPTKAPLPGTDQAFIQKAAELNQLELELCKAAERISANPEVRKAAQAINRDLTSARQQLETLASSKGISLPTTLPQILQDKLTAAESRTAEQFDTAYLQDQIQNKQQIIALYERESTRTTDPDIKAWAKQTLPNLKNHLAILKSTRLPAVGEKSNPSDAKQPGNGSQSKPNKRN